MKNLCGIMTKEIRVEVPTAGDEILSLENIGINDIKRWQIVQTLKIANYHTERLPIAFDLLEGMFEEDLDEEYYKRAEEIEKEANKMFPAWMRDDNQRMQRAIYVAHKKLRELWKVIERKTPKEVEGFL